SSRLRFNTQDARTNDLRRAHLTLCNRTHARSQHLRNPPRATRKRAAPQRRSLTRSSNVRRTCKHHIRAELLRGVATTSSLQQAGTEPGTQRVENRQRSDSSRMCEPHRRHLSELHTPHTSTL